eukprot:TRINITY_DN20404_c0_g1_i1.p1 TRINITY_DN20404_c0_g1~~TRINITY_DN20404_c0_g1_i1.p1  ORF type:complete len:342 (+),score=55.22 TRINITY_DN20404_c0_g1_i1:53-1078(+)
MSYLRGALLSVSICCVVGCSFFEIDTKEGKVIADTIEAMGVHEFDKDTHLDWRISKISADSKMAGPHSDSWIASFNHVGINTGNSTCLLDGINIKGLTVATHTLRQSKYEEPRGGSINIDFNLLACWILSMYESVDDVIQGLQTIRVTNTGGLPRESFFQWAVVDKIKSILVTYEEGKLLIVNNNLGVMTNDPQYSWHEANVKSKKDVEWPADYSPASRFIKMHRMKKLAVEKVPPQNIIEGLSLVTAILNAIHIPKGTVANSPSATASNGKEFTQYVSIKLPSSLQYLYRTYENQQWRSVDLVRLNFTPGESFSRTLYGDGDGIRDVTNNLQHELDFELP